MIYSGKKLQEIIFPLGGIGTGSIGLAGNGGLVDWEIFNRPAKGSLNEYSFFAIKAAFPDGKSVIKVLQGDQTTGLMGKYTKMLWQGYGFGPHSGRMCAFPHFKKVRFDGRFPFATLTFTDDDFPAKVTLQAFNPFIPLDAKNSSIPAAFFDIRIDSYAENVEYTVVLSLANPFPCSENRCVSHKNYTAVKLLYSGKAETDVEYGDMTVAVDQPDGICQEYWYRSGTQFSDNDKVRAFWDELTAGSFRQRHYSCPSKGDVCSVGGVKRIVKGQRATFRFVLSWSIPNVCCFWNPYPNAAGENTTWKNYYATEFADSCSSCFYALDNWKRLYAETARFCRAIQTSTLDKAIIDAVSSTLAVLKSPTVLRLEDGTFYGWEGVHELEGSCEGTCTHVWSYVYSLCFLFPELERSLRETELNFDIDADGRMYFRTALPLGRGVLDFAPCVDGQMATVIKIYRDWKLSGDTPWLMANWEKVQRILAFVWSENNPYEWDRDHDGILEGRQHHTLDKELFGPSAWLQGMYLAALKAAAEMADFLGKTSEKDEYSRLFEHGYAWMRDNLFNGRYFYQKADLSRQEYVTHFECPEYWNEEAEQLKYQIGDGCAIDQMLAQWHANICGLGSIYDVEQRRIALRSLFDNNYKPTLRRFVNMWRVFALNDEAGVVICDYPEGSYKPSLPIPYADECMTGFEYALAGLMISEGMTEEGLTIIRAVRDRYDGEKRNPWNEMECGSNYARSMAAFALLPLCSGFTFDLPHKHIGFSPVFPGMFRCMWNVATVWGEYKRETFEHTITVATGTLMLNRLSLKGLGTVNAVMVDGKKIAFRQQEETLFLDSMMIRKKIRIIVMQDTVVS